MDEIETAWRELIEALAQQFHIYKVLDWLNKKLKK